MVFLLLAWIPPQSLGFPSTWNAVAFEYTPWTGTSPSKLLSERFRYSREERFRVQGGISPDKLFLERSSSRRFCKSAKYRTDPQ